VGFLRHFFLNWKIFDKKMRGNFKPPLKGTLSTLSNYAIPYEVAPQQSSDPLHVTVNTKMININNFLTLSFPHG
jgi:hypothetical protein